MKKITIGIIAHVDSGKTTLSEAMLYLAGSIRQFGRVDKGESFLDNDALERRRGITIFSKQARFTYGNTEFVLIDTPGHTDFSAETERTLQILDYAVLLVSAADGIRGQTNVLWELLDTYRVPVFLFFNKMDQEGADREALMAAARELSDDGAVDFSAADAGTDGRAGGLPFGAEQLEQIAMCSEEAMEAYLSGETVPEEMICRMIRERKLFPCFFGSALRMEGVRELLDEMCRFAVPREYPGEFSAVVYKIARADDNTRLTFVKITGGSVKTKAVLPDGENESKINQIRLYSGNRYELADEAAAGEICALTGLKESRAGMRLGAGAAEGTQAPVLSPVLSYRVLPAEGQDPVAILPYFRILEEESPELSVTWDEEQKNIYVYVMGRVQLEILTSILEERFGLKVSFDAGEVMYQETIAEPVIGVGHFEPLRHYAEVHLLMEPLPRGSGLEFCRDLSTDRLSENWQRLILTHLAEKRHRGVLTGAPLTDIRFTLIAGKAHLKHTEGGDFRQAVYRAVRQGLMMTESILLEPYYRFSLEVPSDVIGRALNDLDRMHAEFSSPEPAGAQGMSVITGRGPVSAMKDYPAELASYTKGAGAVSFVPDGCAVCHNAEEVILQKAYDPERDTRNPADSVFCTHGSGYVVPWDEVYDHMHVPFENESASGDEISGKTAQSSRREEYFMDPEEVDAIIAGFSSANSRSKKTAKSWRNRHRMTSHSDEGQGKGNAGRSAADPVRRTAGAASPAQKKQTSGGRTQPFPPEEADILLVDGYNVIFAWEELSGLAKENIDSARDALVEILSKYRSMTNAEVIAVFDAYKVSGRARGSVTLQGVQMVYTAEDETADQFIERFTSEHGKKKKIAVVTSDAAERQIARGHGSMIIPSAEFRARIGDLSQQLNERFGVK